MTVIVYSKLSCVQCEATWRALERRDLVYRVVDVTADAAAQLHEP